jgi:hypothetical protein
VGKSAERLLIAAAKAAAETVPIRFVQIGSVSGRDITLSSAVLRSSAIELMGSGINSIPLERFVSAIGGVLQAAVPGDFQIAARPVPLSEVELAWPRDSFWRVLALDFQEKIRLEVCVFIPSQLPAESAGASAAISSAYFSAGVRGRRR